MTHIIDRRKALPAIAAAPAALALPAVAGDGTGDAWTTPCKFGIGEGPRSFGVQVLTDDYEPEFPKGSIAIIDPDLAPKDDDLVLAKTRLENLPNVHVFAALRQPRRTRSARSLLQNGRS